MGNAVQKFCLSASLITLRTHDCGTTLVVSLVHDAVLSHGLDEGADVEVAHQHLVVASAVQAGLARLDLFALGVVLVLVVTS